MRAVIGSCDKALYGKQISKPTRTKAGKKRREVIPFLLQDFRRRVNANIQGCDYEASLKFRVLPPSTLQDLEHPISCLSPGSKSEVCSAPTIYPDTIAVVTPGLALNARRATALPL